MPPLGHTVRLINSKQRNLRLLQQAQRPFLDEPFRSQVQKIQSTRTQLGLHLVSFFRAQTRIEVGGFDPERFEGDNLVLHERDEGRDDHAGAGAHQRRNLIAQRFTAAGGHEDYRVAACAQVVDDLFLLAPKRRIAEDGIENFGGGSLCGSHGHTLSVSMQCAPLSIG